MKKPSISVLIPNFNHGHYLPIQLDSMIDQSRPPDEIIIIDDASTDDSIEIINKYVAKYNFIKLIKNKENKGVEYNINKLISCAEGDYIFLSAADDKVLPGFFEEVEKAALQHPDVGVISGIVRLIDADGVDRGMRMMPIISQKGIFLDTQAVQQTLVKYGRWIQVSAMVLKKEYVDAIGGQDQEIGSFADNFLATLMALKHGAYYIPKELGCWRKMDTGYGYVTGSDVASLLRQGNCIGKRMKIDYPTFFESKFISRFFCHWIYMIFQNFGKLDQAQKKEVLRSQAFTDLFGLTNLSFFKIKLIKSVLGNVDNKYLPLFLLAPKLWFLRSRISVWAYSGNHRLKEY